MDKIFFGSWDQFVAQFPHQAQNYQTEELNQETHTQWASLCDTQIAVLYVPSFFEGIISLTDYLSLLSLDILKIIIIVDTKNPVILEEVSNQEQAVARLMHIVLSPGAQCIYTHQIVLHEAKTFIRATITTLYRDASCNYYALYAGNTSIIHYYDSFIRGEHAESFLNGVYCAQQKQKVAIFSALYHYVSEAQSAVVVKGVVTDYAHVSYKGFIFIDQQAHSTQASQENGTLVLAEGATVESIPVLEILNNEVRCTHASAVGLLDETHILYLRARGLSFVTAQRMVLRSYVGDVFSNTRAISLQEKLNEIISVLPLI